MVRLPRRGPARPGPASRCRRTAPDQPRRPRRRRAGRAGSSPRRGRWSTRRIRSWRRTRGRKPAATYWIVMRPGSNTVRGTVGRTPAAGTGRRRPRAGRRGGAALVVTVVRWMLRTRVARTTCSIVRRAAISHWLTVAPRNASGRTEGSIRTNTPASSRRRAKSWPFSAAAAVSTQHAWRRMYDPTRSSGCVKLRSNCHGSRARIQRIQIRVDTRLEQPHAVMVPPSRPRPR